MEKGSVRHGKVQPKGMFLSYKVRGLYDSPISTGGLQVSLCSESYHYTGTGLAGEQSKLASLVTSLSRTQATN